MGLPLPSLLLGSCLEMDEPKLMRTY
jgi:hypothetical protein